MKNETNQLLVVINSLVYTWFSSISLLVIRLPVVIIIHDDDTLLIQFFLGSQVVSKLIYHVRNNDFLFF